MRCFGGCLCAGTDGQRGARGELVVRRLRTPRAVPARGGAEGFAFPRAVALSDPVAPVCHCCSVCCGDSDLQGALALHVVVGLSC